MIDCNKMYDEIDRNEPMPIHKDEVLLNLANEDSLSFLESQIIARNLFDVRIYYTMGEDGVDIITKADSELCNISEEELYKIAIDKLVKTCIIKIKPAETKGKIEHAFLLVRDESKWSIQSNCVWLICPGILSDFAEQQKSNLYILPLNEESLYIFTEQDIEEKSKAENKSKKEILTDMEEYLKKYIEDFDYNYSKDELLGGYDITPILSSKILYYDKTYNELFALKNGEIDKTAGNYKLLQKK